MTDFSVMFFCNSAKSGSTGARPSKSAISRSCTSVAFARPAAISSTEGTD
ncbi:Uncharacterised protein [Vibrio cholerae]|nr:Uncharacterised protein [Vibrio cholerae]